MDGNSGSSGYGGNSGYAVPRLAWLIAGSIVFFSAVLWLLRDLPLPGFAVRAPLAEDRGFVVEAAPIPASASAPIAKPRPTAPLSGPAAASAVAPHPASVAAAWETGPAAAAAASAGTGIVPVPAREVRGAAGDGAPRASVFTVTVPSSRLVYLIDVSGSMFGPLDPRAGASANALSRFQAATEEVRRSIALLPPDVAFNVILFGDRPIAMAPNPVAALPEAKQRAEAFLSRLPDIGGGTDLVAGMGAALKMSPDSIFLLTDGGANEPDWKLLREVRDLESAAVTPSRLYAFGMAPLLDDEGDRLLQKLCLMSGGTYQPMADWKKGATP